MTWGPEAGSEFAGYHIEQPLGEGGMGIVYLARHLRLGRKVALKLLAPQLAADASFRERFIRESQMAAAIDHPNIIPIYDADEREGVLYIAMRYVEGEDLKALLESKGRLAPEQVLGILEQVASALDAAHASGLVHRDVKPANILIARPGNRVFLSDFGAAKETAGPGLTKTGFFIGTVDYSSPEQIEGRPVTPQSDVYALGCVLYECLTGSTPYRSESDAAAIYAHLREPPPAVTAARPELPAELDGVIACAMAKGPEARYPTCTALVSAARAALGRGPATAPAAAPPTIPAARAAPAPSEAVTAPGPPSAETAVSDRPPRRRGLIAAATVALLALAGAGVAIALVATGGGSTKIESAVTEEAGKINRVVTHVLTADVALGSALAALTERDSTKLAAVRSAASRAAEAATRAQGGAEILELPPAKERLRTLLRRALDANLAYAQKVGVAATTLQQPQAKAAETAEASAKQAYTALVAAAPGIAEPDPAAFTGATQLGVLARGTSSTSATETFVETTDSLLRNSADTRGNLNALIGKVQQRSLAYDDARSQIAEFISQRQNLRDRIAETYAPPELRASKELLRRSITASLEDDLAVQNWIGAVYANSPSAGARFRDVKRLSDRASALKARFLTEYNEARSRLLRLPALRLPPPGY